MAGIVAVSTVARGSRRHGQTELCSHNQGHHLPLCFGVARAPTRGDCAWKPFCVTHVTGRVGLTGDRFARFDGKRKSPVHVA